jgi:hypothetical protein
MFNNKRNSDGLFKRLCNLPFGGDSLNSAPKISRLPPRRASKRNPTTLAPTAATLLLAFCNSAMAQTPVFTQIYATPTSNLFGGSGHGIAYAMDNNGYVAFCSSPATGDEIDRGNGGPVSTLLPIPAQQKNVPLLQLNCFNYAVGTNDDGLVSFRATPTTGQQNASLNLVSPDGIVTPIYQHPYGDLGYYSYENVFTLPSSVSNSLSRSSPFPGFPTQPFPTNVPWVSFYVFDGGQPTFYPRLDLATPVTIPPQTSGASWLLAGTPLVKNQNLKTAPAVSPSGDAAALYVDPAGILTASWFPGVLSVSGIQVNVQVGAAPSFGLASAGTDTQPDIKQPAVSLNDLGYASFISVPQIYGSASAFLGLASFRNGLWNHIGTYSKIVSDADPRFGEFCESTSLNRSGQIAFISAPAGALDCHQNLYIASASGDSPIRVVGAGDVIQLNGISWTVDQISSLSAQSLNDKGQVSFVANGHPTNAANVGPRSALIRADLPVGTSPGNPVLPIDTLPGAGGGYLFNENQCPIHNRSGSAGDAKNHCHIDPPVAVGYTFASDAGGNFGSVLIPVPLGGGQSSFTLQVNGQYLTINAGTAFDFKTIATGGVQSFAITDISTSESIDPSSATAFVVGLTFIGAPGGSATFTMIPILSGSPPTITPNLSGTLGQNGWYVSDVAVGFSVLDPSSRVTSRTGCDNALVNFDTATTSFTCTLNGYGGPWTDTVTVRRDATGPTAVITTPVNGGTYPAGSALVASYSCTDAVSGSVSCTGTVPSGSLLSTATTGPQTFSVKAVDAAGNSSITSVSYTVSPTASDTTGPIISPVVIGTLGENGWYRSNVSLTWNVSDAESPIVSEQGCSPSAVTSNTSGTTFTCSATSAGGASSKSIMIKRDADAPLEAVLWPFDGVTFKRNERQYAVYACADLRSGIAQCAGTVPNVTLLDTSNAGTKTFTLNAKDKAGNTRTSSVSYKVK